MGYDDFSNVTEEHYYDGEPRTFNTFLLGFIVSIALPLACLLGLLYATGTVQFTSVKHVVHFLLTAESAYVTNMFIMAFMPSMFGFFFAYKSERWKFGRGYVVGSLLFFALFFIRTAL